MQPWTEVETWVDGSGPPGDLWKRAELVWCRRCEHVAGARNLSCNHRVVLVWDPASREHFRDALRQTLTLRDAMPAPPTRRARWQLVCKILARDLPLPYGDRLVEQAIESALYKDTPGRAKAVRRKLEQLGGRRTLVEWVHLANPLVIDIIPIRGAAAKKGAPTGAESELYDKPTRRAVLYEERVADPAPSPEDQLETKVAKEIQDDRSEELERTLGQWLVRIVMLFARSSSRASVVMPGGSEQFRDVLFRWSALAILADRDGSDGVVRNVEQALERLEVLAETPKSRPAPDLLRSLIADLFPRVWPRTWTVVFDVASASIRQMLNKGQAQLLDALDGLPASQKLFRNLDKVRTGLAQSKKSGIDGAQRVEAERELIAELGFEGTRVLARRGG